MSIVVPGLLMLTVMTAALGVGLLLGILINKCCNSEKVVEKESSYRILRGEVFGTIYVYYQGKIIAREDSMEDALKTVKLHKLIASE